MKIGNLYDLNAFGAFKDSASKFKDAGFAGTILARSLEAVDPTIFRKKYPELALMASGVAADNTGGYAEKITSRRVRPVGAFRNAGDTASNKGKITMAGERSTINVVEREAESSWSDTQIKQAELDGINLPSEFVAYHNEVYMREIDEAGLTGIQGNEGLLNNSAFTATGAAGAAASLTGVQLYQEIADLITDQASGVNNTPEYKGTKVIMPVDVMNIASKKIMDSSGGFGAGTTLAALRLNFPEIEFLSSFRAETGFNGTVSSTVVFSNSREAMVMRIPEPLRIGEVVKIGSFDFITSSKYRVAGLDLLEATAGRILTGL